MVQTKTLRAMLFVFAWSMVTVPVCSAVAESASFDSKLNETEQYVALLMLTLRLGCDQMKTVDVLLDVQVSFIGRLLSPEMDDVARELVRKHLGIYYSMLSKRNEIVADLKKSAATLNNLAETIEGKAPLAEPCSFAVRESDFEQGRL